MTNNDTLLITGFEPFGGEKINPAWETVKALPEQIGKWRLNKLQIPTVFEKAAERVLLAAQAQRPAMILMIGQAGGRAAVTPQVLAINLRHASIMDNEGNQPVMETIIPGGEGALFCSLPLYDIVGRLRAEGEKAALSFSAGAYVCNETYYRVLKAAGEQGIPAVFIHVPYLPSQAGEGVPSMPQESMIHTIKRFIEIVQTL